jgi:hypothetical protein
MQGREEKISKAKVLSPKYPSRKLSEKFSMENKRCVL